MNQLYIILFTAALSSAGTWFYTTKKMAPELYSSIVTKAQGFVDNVRAPSSDCNSRAANTDGKFAIDSEKMNIKAMLKQVKEQQKERARMLKEFEESPLLVASLSRVFKIKVSI